MKKRFFIFVLVIVMTLTLLCGCKTEKTNSNVQKMDEVKIEDLSQYNISYSSGDGVVVNYNHAHFDELDVLWQMSDYVVVASPNAAYADSDQHWLDMNNNEVEFSQIDLLLSYTVRPFKVQKVYKGDDSKLKEIEVCEHVFVNGDEMKVMPDCIPMQQGDKYILFLVRSNYDDDQYFPMIYQGAYNLDDSKNSENKHIDKDMLKQVKERFKDEFK